MPVFTNQLRNGLYNIIPVVCDDMFEYIDPHDGTPTSINEFVCEALGAKKNSKLHKAIAKNFYYGMSLSKVTASEIYGAIDNAVSHNRIRLKECVREFLIRGNFPLIATTFGFPVIEKCIEEAGKQVKAEYYNIDSRNDIPFVYGRVYNTYVYHVFGGERSDRWVYNEQTLLQHMYALQNADTGAKNLSSCICPADKPMRQLLVMGSILPDWLFRFLVYPIYKDRLQHVGGFWISAQNTAQELKQFLLRNEYRFPEPDDEIPNILHQAVEGQNQNDTENSKHYIFVSYKRDNEDKSIGRLIDMLKMYGIVWVDLEKVADAGNPYWANIKKAIQNCHAFIPLITNKYIEVLTSDENKDIDFKQLAESNPYVAIEGNADAPNDTDAIENLTPIAREAYYAIACEKKICPIVISPEPCLPGDIEKMAKDGIRPLRIFLGKTIVRYDDSNPTALNLMFND